LVQEAVARGKQIAQQAAGSAAETVRERGQQHGEDLAASTKQRAQELDQGRSS
jgi:hypothetical protein